MIQVLALLRTHWHEVDSILWYGEHNSHTTSRLSLDVSAHASHHALYQIYLVLVVMMARARQSP